MKKIGAYIVLIWIVGTGAAIPAAKDSPRAVFSIEIKDNEVVMTAQGILLKDLVLRIEKNGVEIKGLTRGLDKPVTFSHRGKSFEIVLRQLLRHLGEKNFAYEFSDDKLVRINVFPRGTQSALIPAEPRKQPAGDMVRLVEIVDVLEESQAEKLGLKKGDYIYKYDGRRVNGHEELVAETFKDEGPTPVSMTIISDGKATRVFLERGFIGIHVRTVTIPQEKFAVDISTW